MPEEPTSREDSHPIRGIILVIAGAFALVSNIPVVDILAARENPVLNKETLSALFYVFALAVVLAGAYQVCRGIIDRAMRDVLLWRGLDELSERRRVFRTISGVFIFLSIGCFYMVMHTERTGVVWWSFLLALLVFLASLLMGTLHAFEVESLKGQMGSDAKDKEEIGRLGTEVSRIRGERDDAISAEREMRRNVATLEGELQSTHKSFTSTAEKLRIANEKLDDRERIKKKQLAITDWMQKLADFQDTLSNEKPRTAKEFDDFRDGFLKFANENLDESERKLLDSTVGIPQFTTARNLKGDQEMYFLALWRWGLRLNQFVGGQMPPSPLGL